MIRRYDNLAARVGREFGQTFNVLAFDTSADDTSVSVVNSAKTILSRVSITPFDLLKKYGGISPKPTAERHKERLPEALEEALNKARVTLSDIDAIGVTCGPGFALCLHEGVEFATELSRSSNIPLFPVNHLEGHVLSPRISSHSFSPSSSLVLHLLDDPNSLSTLETESSVIQELITRRNPLFSKTRHKNKEDHDKPSVDMFLGKSIHDIKTQFPPDVVRKLETYHRLRDVPFPYLSLLVSGGNTALILAKALGDYEIIAETTDDAIGEAFDKTARLLQYEHSSKNSAASNLCYAAKKAPRDNPIKFPIPLANKKHRLEFSFAGLKTSVSRKALELYENETASTDTPQEDSEDSTKKTKPDNISKIPIDGITLPDETRQNIAAAFQSAAVEHVMQKLTDAITNYLPLHSKRTGLPPITNLTLVGGAASNKILRERVLQFGKQKLLDVRIPPEYLCLDNASMIAWTVVERINAIRYTCWKNEMEAENEIEAQQKAEPALSAEGEILDSPEVPFIDTADVENFPLSYWPNEDNPLWSNAVLSPPAAKEGLKYYPQWQIGSKAPDYSLK